MHGSSAAGACNGGLLVPGSWRAVWQDKYNHRPEISGEHWWGKP